MSCFPYHRKIAAHSSYVARMDFGCARPPSSRPHFLLRPELIDVLCLCRSRWASLQPEELLVVQASDRVRVHIGVIILICTCHEYVKPMLWEM
jgi:hypothetical protein